MTIVDGVLWSIVLGSLFVLFGIAKRKAPQLSIVDPLSSQAVRTRETKHALLEERMVRQGEEGMRNIWRATLAPAIKALQESFQRFAGKLTALERRYIERQRKDTIAGTVDIHRMLDGAKACIARGECDAAEQELIAVLTHEPKNIDAYEILGRMYLAQGQYGEAKEALEFLVKLAPKNASVLAALGEVFSAEHDTKTAYDFYKKAKNISPNNPKYLDFFICSAIDVGAYDEAKASLDHLREVNPENQKISVFQEMIMKKETK